MEYKAPKFDNSEEAIKQSKQDISEAQKFVYGWMKDKGISGYGYTLDLDDVFEIMSEYKRQSVL